MADFPQRRTVGADIVDEAEQLRMFRAMASLIPGVGYLFDVVEQKMMYASEGIQALLGVEAEAFSKMDLGAIGAMLPPGDLDQIIEDWKAREEKGPSDEPLRTVRRILSGNGSLRHLMVSEKVFARNPDGSVRSVVGVSIDLTDTIRAQSLHQESEVNFQKVFREAPIWISITELSSGRFLDVNEQALADTGYTMQDLVGRTSIEVGWLTADDRAVMMREFEAHGRIPGMEMRFRAKDGRILYGFAKGEPIQFQGVPCLLTATMDITQRKAAEEGLKATSERLALAVRAGNVGIWDVDLVHDIPHWDDQMFLFYGIDPRESRDPRETWLRGIHPDDKPRADADLHMALRGEKDFDTEYRVVWPDGTIRILKGIASVIRDADGTPVRMIGTNWDVTAARRVELELRESEYFFRESQRASRTGSYRLDLGKGTWSGSDVLSDVLGMDVRIPRSRMEWNMLVHPDDRESMAGTFEADVLERRNRFNKEFRIVRASDGETRWVHGMGEVEVGADGSLTAMLGTIRDITEQKLAALELDLHRNNLELLVAERTAQLEEANRELESFSYTVSHDLRAPLRHIDGFVDLLAEASPDLDPERRHYLETISSSARKMGTLIDDLLRFSRTSRQELKRQSVDMGQLVREIRASLVEQNPDRAVEWDLGVLPRVEGDASLLRQVWINLMGNALKYSRDRNPARIRIGSRTESEGIVFEIQDNGVGFDMRYAGKLFGVFQRLHRQDQFEGTGIGLVTVQRIVARHGGRIWAESIPGSGATFSFTLPCHQGAAS